MDGVKVVFLAEDRVRILANEVKQNSSLRFLGMIERVQQVIVIAPAARAALFPLRKAMVIVMPHIQTRQCLERH